MVSDKIIAQLKSDIERKLGKEIGYEKNFIELSKIILEETNEQISVSTLKRFFGKVTTNFKPSKYTLETLVAFLGFEDWHAYLNGLKESNSVKKELLVFRDLSMGYRELISCGLIYEYTVPEELLDQHVYVKFSQHSILEFILLGKWLRTKPLDVKLIHEIKEFYHNNSLLQCKLMQLCAKLLLHQEEYDTIRQLQDVQNPVISF